MKRIIRISLKNEILPIRDKTATPDAIFCVGRCRFVGKKAVYLGKTQFIGKNKRGLSEKQARFIKKMKRDLSEKSAWLVGKNALGLSGVKYHRLSRWYLTFDS